MDLDQVMRRVQGLIAKAESSEFPEEAENCQDMAERLIKQYNIEQIDLDKKRPAAERMKPGSVEVALTGDSTLVGYMAALARDVSAHCSCKVWNYNRIDHEEHTYMSKVYGYEPDRRYFLVMYTTLRLHMVGALRPTPDPNKSIEDNAYDMHNAGLNWFDIAKLYGWYQVTPEYGEPANMYVNRRTHERANWPTAIGVHKRAYARAIEARGERPLRIPPAGVNTFRVNAAEAYTTRINQRLLEIRRRNPIGTELALRVDEVDDLFNEETAHLRVPVAKTTGRVRATKIKRVPYSQAAYEAGVRHANSANLNPAASNDPRRELG